VDQTRFRLLAPVGAMTLLAVTAAFVQLSPTPGYTSAPPAQAPAGAAGSRSVATPAAPAAQPSERVVTARRGTLTDTLTLNGRIGTAGEVPVSFRSPQRISAVRVSPGDAVTAGQVLAEADQSELARALGAARERLSTANTKLQQAQDLADRQQKRTEIRQTMTESRTQRGVTDAEAAVRQAEADLQRIQQGASPAERRASEMAVFAARAAFARADTDLNKLREGPEDLEYQQANQQVAEAQLAHQKAQHEYDKLVNGTDQSALRAAEREYLSAQNGLSRAQADLQKLREPDYVSMTAAEREVDRARSALRVAEIAASTPIVRSSSDAGGGSSRAMQAERQAAVLNARIALQSANERLRTVKAGPPAVDLLAAQRNLTAAQSALDAARDRMEQARQGPDSLTVSQAQLAVDGTRLAYASAAARLAKLGSGTAADQVTAALTGLQSAEMALRSAEAQQAEMLARPTGNDLSLAEETLRKARETLQAAKTESELPPDDPAEQRTADLGVLQQVSDQEQAAVAALESDLMNARLLAPFDGRVVATVARPKDGVDAGKPVVIVAPVGDEQLVLADVPAADAARLVVGQQAALRYGGAASGEADAPIANIIPLAGGTTRVTLQPTWTTPPTVGSPVSIAIVAAQRQDVVLLPEAALRGSGKTRVVDLLEGESRRQAEVTVGLVSGGDAEIVSGLGEGAQVILAP
jgi:HlyD family secretion protein